MMRLPSAESGFASSVASRPVTCAGEFAAVAPVVACGSAAAGTGGIVERGAGAKAAGDLVTNVENGVVGCGREKTGFGSELPDAALLPAAVWRGSPAGLFLVLAAPASGVTGLAVSVLFETPNPPNPPNGGIEALDDDAKRLPMPGFAEPEPAVLPKNCWNSLLDEAVPEAPLLVLVFALPRLSGRRLGTAAGANGRPGASLTFSAFGGV